MVPSTRILTGTVTLAVVCLLLVGLTGVGGAQSTADATQGDSCTTIDEPGQYVLTEDIENSSEAVCIDIQSDNVTFDGNGHLVEGNLSRATIEEAAGGEAPRTRVGVGVNVRTDERVSNVTVRNVTTTSWFHGVLSENVTDGTTSGVTATDNGGGIIYDNSSGVTVANSTSSDNVILGIIIDSRAGVPNADNRIVDNTAEGNGFFGAAVFLSNNSTVAGNTLTENTFGIFAYGTSDSAFVNNDATNNSAVGLALEGDLEPTVTEADDTDVEDPVEAAEPAAPPVFVAQNNVVANNDFSESGAIGIGLIGPSETAIVNNDVSDIPDTSPFPLGFPTSGIYLSEASNNVVVGADASDVNGSGIVVETSSNGNRVIASDASDNAVDGVAVNGSNQTTLVRIVASDNGDDGIDINDADGVVISASTLQDNGDQPIEVTNSTGVQVRSTNVGAGPAGSAVGPPADGPSAAGDDGGPPAGAGDGGGQPTDGTDTAANETATPA